MVLGVKDAGAKRATVREMFTSWTPDQPAFDSQGLTFLQNAVPRATGAYQPARSLRRVSRNLLSDLSPVTRAAGGTVGFRDPVTGTVNYYAGAFDGGSGRGKIFSYNEGLDTWFEASRAGFYKFSKGGQFRFCQDANRIYAALGTDERIQRRTGSNLPFEDVSNTAPCGVDVAIVREFLVVLRATLEPGRIEDELVHWSGFNDTSNFPDPNQNNFLSGQFRLVGGGRLKRIVPGLGGNDAVIFGEKRIWRMNFVGQPSVWRFDVAEDEQGTTIAGSVAWNDKVAVFYGRNGFRVFDGSSSQAIGAGVVDRTFLEDPLYRADGADPSGFQDGYEATIDNVSQNYMLAYRTLQPLTTDFLTTATGELIATAAGEPIEIRRGSDFNDSILFWNLQSNQWGHARIGADSIGRIDSQRTSVGQPRVVAIGRDGSLSLLDGPTLEAVFDTAERIDQRGTRIKVHRALPFTDAPNVFLRLRIRDAQQAALTDTPDRALDRDGMATIRESFRFGRLRMRIPAGTEWTYALGVHVEAGDWGVGGKP